MMKSSDRAQVLFISTYPPRECGIATFTRDLVSAIDKRSYPSIKTRVLALNRNGTNIYNYPKKVFYQINDSDIEEYIRAAKRINSNSSIKLVCIQHEFGIFGGENGSYLPAFLEILKKPVVITLHSVIPKPGDQLKKTMQSVARRVNTIIVMNRLGREILRKDYNIQTPIQVIPHGIPYVPLVSPKAEKKRLGYEERLVLSSFGMLNEGKGYENVIGALPEIVKQFPNILYLILGETHPVVRKKEGEAYRNFLETKVKELGLEKNVKFYNKYLTLKEILNYLKATDIYISSGKDPNQITSGTLSYAMGCGRPVISTPFLHAREAVTPEKGILVKFDDSKSFQDAIFYLLLRPDKRKEMGTVAYHYTRKMTWENVALEYLDVFKKNFDVSDKYKEALPEIRFNHIMNLTDNFGIIQFAKNTVPDVSSGYCLDDAARAMLVCTKYYNKYKDVQKLKFIELYLNFIQYVQDEDGKFYNFVDSEKNINHKNWGQDAHGRALWALGYLIASNDIPEKLRYKAKAMFDKALGISQHISSPRAICFSLLGYHFYNDTYSTETSKSLIVSLSNNLVSLFKENTIDDWKWFENSLTYNNSKFPEALFYAYLTTKDKTYLDVALKSLDFLVSTCFENDLFIPIGQKGWYLRGNKRAYFDQQPLEASSMVETLLVAYKVTNNSEYLDKAKKAFHWFLGKNTLKQVLYNESTGGCYDGLGEYSININQGAESTVSYLLARISLEEFVK
ncbi:MAG: glycosyltransferase [Nanoarchaeota archaeon]|nr:glycosyltransferase [Nanoarchaeota archaeon]